MAKKRKKADDQPDLTPPQGDIPAEGEETAGTGEPPPADEPATSGDILPPEPAAKDETDLSDFPEEALAAATEEGLAEAVAEEGFTEKAGAEEAAAAEENVTEVLEEPEATEEGLAEAVAEGEEASAEEPEAAEEDVTEEGLEAEESLPEEAGVEEPEGAAEEVAEAIEEPEATEEGLTEALAEGPLGEEAGAEEPEAIEEGFAEAAEAEGAFGEEAGAEEPIEEGFAEAVAEGDFAEEPEAAEEDLAEALAEGFMGEEAEEPAAEEDLDLAEVAGSLLEEPQAGGEEEPAEAEEEASFLDMPGDEEPAAEAEEAFASALSDEDAAAEELLDETDEVSLPEEAALTVEMPALDETTAEGEAEDEDLAAAEGVEEEAGLAEEELPAEEEEAVEEPPPRPKVSVLTIILLFLNVVAALAFAVLFVMDFSKRQEWSYRIFQHDLLMQGLPLRSEENRHTSTSRELMPRKKLTPEQLAAVYQERTRKNVANFQALEEAFKAGIRPEHLSPEALQDHFAHFQGVGAPVKTLEEEIERLKAKLTGDIEEAAKEGIAAAKDKRQLLAKLWLPLAANATQIENVDEQIKNAKDADLNSLLLDFAQRRFYQQILGPLDGFRPEAPQKSLLEKIADPNLLKLEALKKLLEDRLDVALADQYNPELQFGSDWAQEKRESIEKRQYIAFVLCVLGEVKKLDGTPLYPQGAERGQLVVGLYEYSLAMQALTNILLRLEPPLLEAIRREREGFGLDDNKQKSPGFVNLYQAEAEKIKDLVAYVKEMELRLKERKELCQREQKVYDERLAHLKDVTAKVVAARQETYKLKESLDKMRDQLFKDQRYLANAFQENLRLEEEIQKAYAAFRKGRRP